MTPENARLTNSVPSTKGSCQGIMQLSTHLQLYYFQGRKFLLTVSVRYTNQKEEVPTDAKLQATSFLVLAGSNLHTTQQVQGESILSLSLHLKKIIIMSKPTLY